MHCTGAEIIATAPVSNQGKGKFLRVFLEGHRDARRADATAAWQAEGHDDGISESLFSKIRSELGLTAKRAPDGVAKGDAGPSRAKGEAKSGGPKAGAKKVDDTTPQLDGRDGESGSSKSAFVGEVLGRLPGANQGKVNEALASAGHKDTISPSIFYKVK